MEYKDLWDYALHNGFNQKLKWDHNAPNYIVLEQNNKVFVLRDKRSSKNKFILSYYLTDTLNDLFGYVSMQDIDSNLSLISQITLLNTFITCYS